MYSELATNGWPAADGSPRLSEREEAYRVLQLPVTPSLEESLQAFIVGEVPHLG